VWKRLLRAFGFLAYLLTLFAVFSLSAYLAFSFFVRSGATTVPDVSGLSRPDAAARLADQGLEMRMGKNEGRYDDKVAAGRVVWQRPEKGTLAKRGSRVEIILSLGPRRVEAPELAGNTMPATQIALTKASLVLGKVLYAFDATRPLDTVIEQDPDAGANVPPSSPVDVLVAMPTTGERYVMPDLVYRHYDVVRPFFDRRNFRFGNVRFERYEGVSAGVILRQFPLPGHPVSPTEPISLVVATSENLFP
jgi:eukaryotic-like serine/threonine-protein kinase